MLTLCKLGPNCQKQTSLSKINVVLQKYKANLSKLAKIRLTTGGMEDTFPVHGWWPGEDSIRSRFQRDGCEAFDITKLPKAAFKAHFLSLKPSVLPQNLQTIVLDDNNEESARNSDDEQDDNGDDHASAGAQHPSSLGSDEEDEDQASEGAPPGHVSPPHTPCDSDDEFNDLMTPPQPTAEKINVDVLSHHISKENLNLIPGQVPRPHRLILRPPTIEDPSEVSLFVSFITLVTSSLLIFIFLFSILCLNQQVAPPTH
ncbi:hypothetical protein PQX77_020208 [Marasmius sp. AFHP31]|nr:hypothetical protein PQX77_020208 [Marasmius sp. AFHP31]